MPLPNDMGRCHGVNKIEHDKTNGAYFSWICPHRKHCARYVERNQGGPRTMIYAYLCTDGEDNYIPAEKQHDSNGRRHGRCR